LAWHLGRGTAAIPKCSDPARIRENLGAESLRLEPGDVRILDRQDQGRSAMARHLPVDAAGWVVDEGEGPVNVE
jgi:diketogulonate reductase-like aldo/keto reductase